GDFTLTDSGSTLAVTGPVSASNGIISLTGAPALTVSGSITAGRTDSIPPATSKGSITLGADSITLTDSAVVMSTEGCCGGAGFATVKLSAGAGGIALNNATVRYDNGPVDLNSAGGITQGASGSIIANQLRSSGGNTGTVSLLGSN